MSTLYKFLAVPPATVDNMPIDFITDDGSRIDHVTRLWTEAGWTVTVKTADVEWNPL